MTIPQTSRLSVTLKLATSLDGAIALASGESKWITGPEARAAAHGLRAAHDAVLIGVGTALADDPLLTARTDPAPERQPLRVVLDRRLRLPASSKLARSVNLGPVTVISPEPAVERPAALAETGVQIEIAAPQQGEGEIAAVLRLLSERFGVKSVMIEGGAGVAAAFLREGLIDRLEFFRAPVILGGDSVRAIGGLGLLALDAATRFQWVASQRLGPDLWESYQSL